LWFVGSKIGIRSSTGFRAPSERRSYYCNQ
jgi:hypothetical protein